MKVSLQLYDGKPLSASIPKRATCIIKEVHANVLGQTVTPRYATDKNLQILICVVQRGHQNSFSDDDLAPWLIQLLLEICIFK